MAHIDMTHPEGTCPSPLVTTASPRTCSPTSEAGCSSVFFSTFIVPYTEVCGRAFRYQHYSTDDFHAGHLINGPYVDGVSITSDTPRHHLQTYAAGEAESGGWPPSSCPCAHASATQLPSFVGDNYNCESGNVDARED